MLDVLVRFALGVPVVVLVLVPQGKLTGKLGLDFLIGHSFTLALAVQREKAGQGGGVRAEMDRGEGGRGLEFTVFVWLCMGFPGTLQRLQ